jgi:transcriptional regulator with XRE-family HTH domain
MVTRRELTAAEKRAAAKLKQLYARKRDVDVNLTQETLAAELRITQPALSQYMNGIVPLGLDIVLQLAEALEVAPADIYPEITKIIQRITHRIKEEIIPIMGTVTGEVPQFHQVAAVNIAVAKHCYAVHVDTDEMSMYLPPGTYLIVNPLGVLRKNHKVVFRLENNEAYHVGLLEEITDKQLRYRCFRSGKTVVQKINRVRTLHAICAEQYPTL